MSALETLVGNMTVAQLAQAAGMEIDEVVALVLGSGGKAPVKAVAAKRGRKPGRKPAPVVAEADAPAAEAPEAEAPAAGSHNTRTRAGREALDKAIIDYLKQQSEPVRALDIRKGIGGTAAQIRTRLNYLIERNKVTYKGRASGTRYKAK